MPVGFGEFAAWCPSIVKTDTGSTVTDWSGNGRHMTLTNSPTWTADSTAMGSRCLAFNGTNQYGSAALDLTGTSIVTVSWWMYWNAYANDDDLAFEFGSPYWDKLTGFMCDPNAAAGYFVISHRGNVGYSNPNVSRPSAAAWHHYVAVFDKTLSTDENLLWVDGTLQTPATYPLNANNTDAFGNHTLTLMCRGGSSLFGAGRIDDMRIYTRRLINWEVMRLSARRGHLVRPDLILGGVAY